jgi:hypothetical protein
MTDSNASDWSDLDLLTVTEARERLTAEIAVTQREIAAAEEAGGGASDAGKLEALRRRLVLLQERLGP